MKSQGAARLSVPVSQHRDNPVDRAAPSAGWPESTSAAGRVCSGELWFAVSFSTSEHPSLSAELLL